MRLLLPLALIGAYLIVDPRNASAFEFAQAAVVDSGESVGYLMAPGARVDEVDLSSGDVLAISTRGSKPLLLFGDVLLTQADVHDQNERLRLVGLNSKDLSVTFEIDVALPYDVPASIDDRLGASFYVGARVDSGEIVVQWRSVQRRISGAPTNEPAHVTTGWAQIDPNDGRLTGSGVGEPPVRESREGELPAIVRNLVDSGVLASQPCQVDDLVAAIEYRKDDGATTVRLRRWHRQTGESLPDVELFGSERTFRNFSADCRYLLASRATGGWLWSIYSITLGNRIAEVHMSLPASQFFISKTSLIYVLPAVFGRVDGQLRLNQPRKLLAVDLNTGKELWSRPIRETTYLGPFPGRLPNTF
jgi:hypothetical protein